VVFVAERLRTIPITCGVDGQEHEVTDENMAAGRHAGRYQALCGYRVVAAAMVAPAGRPCFQCTEVLAAAQRPAGPARRGRHHWNGWLWRKLYPSRNTARRHSRRK
jgi:hypothetical protein